MFVRIPNSYNQLELNILNSFDYYKSTIYALHHTLWNEEDIEGKGNCILYKLGKYNLAILYVSLIWLDIQAGYMTWNQIKTKYEIDRLQQCYACEDISLTKLFEFFGLQIIEEGTENMGIENSLFIEENIQNNYQLTDALLVYYNSIQNNPCSVSNIKSFA